MKKLNLIFALLITSTFLVCCSSDDDSSNSTITETTTFDIFTVQADKTTAVINGEIKSRTLEDFNTMLEEFPNINLLQFEDAPGSNDDEINFQVGVLLHQNGISTHLLDNAEVASGGVDLFLAGINRTRGNNTNLGVHSWSDSDGNEATDFPNNSEEHTANIEYYENIGYIPQWANDFYFFTINAAPADDIHWMTEDEIIQYSIISQ